MSPVRSVLVISLCLVFLSKSLADSDDDFEEDDEGEELERPPPTKATKRAKAALQRPRPLHESAHAPQGDTRRLNCPLCDSSVYSYCSDKLLHDACCCLSPSDTDDLPPQCNYADCSFLHANTCKEHRLITACCCNQRL